MSFFRRRPGSKVVVTFSCGGDTCGVHISGVLPRAPKPGFTAWKADQNNPCPCGVKILGVSVNEWRLSKWPWKRLKNIIVRKRYYLSKFFFQMRQFECVDKQPAGVGKNTFLSPLLFFFPPLHLWVLLFPLFLWFADMFWWSIGKKRGSTVALSKVPHFSPLLFLSYVRRISCTSEDHFSPKRQQFLNFYTSGSTNLQNAFH